MSDRFSDAYDPDQNEYGDYDGPPPRREVRPWDGDPQNAPDVPDDEGPPEMPLATLHYAWVELDILARLVDRAIARFPKTSLRWTALNSLRTSLREAQYTLRRP